MSSLPVGDSLDTITRPIKLILAIVFGGFCMTVGGIIMKVSLSDLLDARESHQWVPAAATLDVARVVRNAGRGSSGYSQEIRYHFRVGGAYYEGSRLSFNRQSTKTSEESMAMLPSTTPGSQIIVYFDANDPSRNVVYRGIDKMMFIPPLFALVSLLVGAAVAGLQVRRFLLQKRHARG
ncbi:MAG TPA: DUF3592 domain-containing protein [Noviherbaspirillum sp.]|nr:DUF3592 domain-containing protein [Noviherbaspirillum sp.]